MLVVYRQDCDIYIYRVSEFEGFFLIQVKILICGNGKDSPRLESI